MADETQENSPAGKTPPSNLEAERSVLGSIMLDASSAEADNRVLDLCLSKGITPDSFYGPRNKTIFAALTELSSAGMPVDCVTLDELPDWDTYDPKLPEVKQTTPEQTTVTTSGKAAEGELVGDVDCSGTVDVSDAVLLARFVAEDKTAAVTAAGKRNADCDGKQGIDGGDTTRILMYIAKLISKADFEARK